MRKFFYLMICLFLAACGSQSSTNISSDTSGSSGSIKLSAQSVIAQMEKGGQYRDGELLVKFKPGVKTAASASVHQAMGSTVIMRYTIVKNLDHVKLPQGVSVKAAILHYMADPNVEYAEPNYIRRIASVIPNDTYFPNQWALLNTGQYAYGTAGADIKATEAWDVTMGFTSTVVAVLDTGVDYTHQDLVGNIWRNMGEVNASCLDNVDNDMNGFIDDCVGWDFIGPDYEVATGGDNAPMDGHGHGTHVAGIIGAVGNNGVGISGVMWKVRLMPVKVLDDSGTGTDAQFAAGIQYAVNNGAKVINASLGGFGYSSSVYDAITGANLMGVLFVAAAGNDGSNNDLAPFYPASYELANIIAVAATDQDDRRVSFSNYGLNSVHVAAPGTYILSTIPNGLYSQDKEFSSGTSMAAPHVAGLGGLLSGYYYNFTLPQIRTMLLTYVDALPTLDGWIATGGRINAFKASSSLWTPTGVTPTVVSPFEISLIWIDRATAETNYRIYRRTDSTSYALRDTIPANTTFYSDSGLTDGTRYHYKLAAFNSIGESPDYPGNETFAVTSLNPPTNLQTSALSGSQVRLTWSDHSQTEEFYVIERKTVNTEFSTIAQVNQNTQTFTDTTAQPVTKYWYRVRAYNAAAGFSAFSNESEVTTPASGGGHRGGGGGGCSIGAPQNTPTACADLLMLLIPAIVLAFMRRRR